MDDEAIGALHAKGGFAHRPAQQATFAFLVILYIEIFLFLRLLS